MGAIAGTFSQSVRGWGTGEKAGRLDLKPFLYAHAFDRRILTPASILDDTPLDMAVFNGIYQPRNYDSQFRGR